jgi:hypothetical protein
MIETIEDFISFYNKYKRFPDGSYVSKNGYNFLQMERKYKRYRSSLEKRKEKMISYMVDEKWIRVKKEVGLRDKYTCRLYPFLTAEEKEIIEESFFGGLKEIDYAHVFNKSKYKFMKYLPENVVCLSRLFHARLDIYRDPITGKNITKEEVENWWKRIVGEEQYTRLLNISVGYNRG